MKELIKSLVCRRPHRRETAVVAAVTAIAAIIGAFAGAMAYYNGWLG